MHETLQKFRFLMVQVERRFSEGGRHICLGGDICVRGPITQHIHVMLDSAYKKYMAWQSRKRSVCQCQVCQVCQ